MTGFWVLQVGGPLQSGRREGLQEGGDVIPDGLGDGRIGNGVGLGRGLQGAV